MFEDNYKYLNIRNGRMYSSIMERKEKWKVKT